MKAADFRIQPCWFLLLVSIVLLALLRAAPVRAAGAVGTGTPESCTEAALDEMLAGGGLVTFDCGAEPVTITLTSEKAISADTTIDGGGLVTISGGNSVGVFSVNAGVAFTVQNLTISNGNSAVGGGGIENMGGQVNVTNSTFADNSAGQWGGGIYNHYTGGYGRLSIGTLGVSNSTFTGNSAPSGGSIHNIGGRVNVTNSTFADNSAGTGGGIYSRDGAFCSPRGGCGPLRSNMSLYNSTFTDNSATTGGAIFQSEPSGWPQIPPSKTRLRNTIVAGSPSGGNCAGGNIIDDGHNLDDGTTCGFSTANDSLSNTDPKLDSDGLKDNGGPTLTIALLPGSPAIDAGDSEVCANPPVDGLDQRGYVRPGTGSATCSIGAYEFDSPGPPPCTGDCDENGVIEIHELVTLVNIGLGISDVSACDAGDRDSDDEISISEIIVAVGYGLRGCPLDPVARACIDSGGELTTSLCCESAGDFPDTCAIGACGCPPDGSHEVRLCDCGPGMCFDGSECVEG